MISCRIYVSIGGLSVRVAYIMHWFPSDTGKDAPIPWSASSSPDRSTGRTLHRCHRGQISNVVEIWIFESSTWAIANILYWLTSWNWIFPIMNFVTVLPVLLFQFVITLYSCHTWSSRFNFSCVVGTRLSLRWHSCCRADWSNLHCDGFFLILVPGLHKNIFWPRTVGFLTLALRNYNWKD